MALNADDGQRMLQIITSRYNDWRWRKKIEKTLSLPQSGMGDENQQAIFLYLKQNLKAYKSRRADPDAWMVGGFATKQVVDRIKATPSVVAAHLTSADTDYVGTDPGTEVTESWWEDMLVSWFDQPEPETPPEEAVGEGERGQENEAAPKPAVTDQQRV